MEYCCHTATKLDLDAWDGGALDVLKEILCYCCNCHPTYLTGLREDSLLMLTEVHREYLKGYTPPTEAYVKLCTRVQRIAMVAKPPLPVWSTTQRRSGRAHRLHALTSVAVDRGWPGASSGSVE